MSTLIILPSVALGGVEKRLSGLFVELRRRGEQVRLVAAKRLVDALAATDDCAGVAQYPEAVDAFAAGSDAFGSLRARLQQLFVRHPDSVFHYGLASPLRLHRRGSPRTLYTIPNASLRQYNARGLLEVYGGVLRASRVDVLDPQVYRQLTDAFWWRRGSISLTPGSYVDLEVFRASAEKRQLVAFSGLFSEEKQAPRLVAALPEVMRRLADLGLGDTEVCLLGRDPEGGHVTRDVAALGDSRIRAYHSSKPGDVLATAKVFLSLQRSTNHPSKALLEAMACGAAPVVTDTRDSRLTAPDELATYVPRDFSARDLAEACAPLLRRDGDAVRRNTESMRAFLAKRFSIGKMADYYAEHYSQLRSM